MLPSNPVPRTEYVTIDERGHDDLLSRAVHPACLGHLLVKGLLQRRPALSFVHNVRSMSLVITTNSHALFRPCVIFDDRIRSNLQAAAEKKNASPTLGNLPCRPLYGNMQDRDRAY